MKFKKIFEEVLMQFTGVALVVGTMLIVVQLPKFLFAGLVERVTLMMGLLMFGASVVVIHMACLRYLYPEDDDLSEFEDEQEISYSQGKDDPTKNIQIIPE